MSNDKGLVVVFATTPKGKGKEIASKIVESKLAACVNVVSSITSFYWWQGKVVEDQEELLIIKTKSCLVDQLKEYVKKIHPYTVPEIVVIGAIDVLRDYHEWAVQETLPCEG